MPRLSLAKLERHLYSAADRLRQEGLDAATYKDYIFGMLFLKRCSDVFDAERDKIVGAKARKGMTVQEAEATFGENPDYYDGFFVPERARWTYLQSKLNDASEPFGGVLDKALGALSEANETLEHVLDHISFMRTQGNKRVLSDDACKDLIRHFSKHSLRNEDFQFSDLLGSAYEFLINMFAESAGKKGGDFYTPRDVIRLMVRMLQPKPGMSIYDPTCGSGGMLIISREFIEHSGGDASNLRLCGQVNDASAWSICRLNMLLHGVPGADIQLEDTLLHPLHRESGELERFDRVIANPPFSQNYTKSNMEFPERFRWGWCPTTGKKGDLMFAQHMLAVCKPGGMVATVMPHGVLFRGGAEKEIRRRFLEQDLIEAVIGLPQNLFYGAGIPACILVMRPSLTGQAPNKNKPSARQGKVLFINADAEFHAGRAQNYLRPEHIEKIASTFDRYEDVLSFARIVSVEEIASEANEFNLNIRRYVDNSPPPEPHDVRAHLLGGVPVAEVTAQAALFQAVGFDPMHAFVKRKKDKAYYDFSPALSDRAAIRPLVENDPGVQARSAAVRDQLTKWWTSHAPHLADLPKRRDLNRVRTEFLDSFVAALLPLGTLDRFKLSGVIATWWTETLPDFKTLLENGFPGVIDGWIDAIADALEDDDNAGPAFDPFGHKLVQRTMKDYLERIAATKADITRLKGEKEAFEQSNPPDDLDEEELASWNYAKDLEGQIKEAKAAIKAKLHATKPLKERQKALTKALKANKNSGAGRGKAKSAAQMEMKLDGNQVPVSPAPAELEEVLSKIAGIEASCEPDHARIAAVQTELAPYEAIKVQLADVRARYRELTADFVDVLRSRCDTKTLPEKQALVLDLFAQDVQAGLDAAVEEKRWALITFCEALWTKYQVTLTELAALRQAVEGELNQYLVRLEYL